MSDETKQGELYLLFKYRAGSIQTREHFLSMQEQRDEKAAYQIILDEARADFPDGTDEIYHHDDGYEKEFLGEKYRHAVNEWKQRWFGKGAP